MKMVSAIIVSGALLFATAYTLRSHAAEGLDRQGAATLASGTPWVAYAGVMGGAVHSTQQCAGDYICDEYDAWMAIGIDE